MWSNADSAWKGFQPVPYLLDREKVFNLPFVKLKTNGSAFIEDGDTTLGSILVESAEHQVRAMESWCVKNSRATHEDADKVLVSGAAFLRRRDRERSLGCFGSGHEQHEDVVASHSDRPIEDDCSLRAVGFSTFAVIRPEAL